MEYKNKKMYSHMDNMKMGYPEGYHSMGMDDDNYKKTMKKKAKKMKGYHDMNGYKMKGNTHMGPEGYWGIPGMSNY